jgi:glutathione S-transferase
MMDLTAVAEFRRLAQVLGANRLLTAGNTALLAHLAMLHARITATWLSGETPTAALLAIYRRLSGDLGLTHMPVPAPASKPNKFAELARRCR